MGLLCSGPVEGAMILDMTKKVTKDSGRSRADKRRSPVRSTSVASQGSTPPRTADSFHIPCFESKSSGLSSPSDGEQKQCWTIAEKNSSQCQPVADALCLQLDPSELFRSCNSDAFEQAFLAQFIKLITSLRLYQYPRRPRSWIFDLPTLIYTSHTPTVKYSVRAAALAHYAFLHKNKSVQNDSRRWYIAGLESQRRLLESPEWDESHRTATCSKFPDHENICVPMMFTCFELWACTTPRGWLQHQMAASKLLEMRGPTNCEIGVEHLMFRSLRVFAVCLHYTHSGSANIFRRLFQL